MPIGTNIVAPPTSSRMRYSWLQTVLLSLGVSLLVQYGLPWLESNATLKSSICDSGYIPQGFKLVLNCNVQQPVLRKEQLAETSRVASGHRALSESTTDKVQVTYFHEPFPLERWSGVDDTTAKEGELLLKAPSSISALGSRPEPWTEAEALAALHAARRSRESGNYKRAESIIEHAFAMAPNSPEVLYEYGLFVEIVRKNIVEAEGYYKKALNFDPSHSGALVRRAKALPLVEDIDNRMLREINRKRDIFLQIPWNNSGLKRAMRDSYFQHVYHTVALEGNTMSLVQTRVVLETRMAVSGKSIVEHNEILGMDAALRFLNQTLAHVGKLTMQDILAIHKRVLGFVDPIAAGVLRSTQVYVGSFTPTSPEYVLEEMAEMIDWLNDEETLRIDPVELAALAHYKLVYIHPFIDGNGRTARLLMNFILMQSGFPPVIIPVEERGRYYASLRAANEGDLRPFIRFIAELTDKTLESFIASSSVCNVNECHTPDSEVTAERIIY